MKKAPTRKENKMQFRSRFLDLLLKKQAAENRVISVQEIANETKLSKQTIYDWKSRRLFDQLDSDTADAFLRYFACTLNDLVELVPRKRKSA